MKREVRSGRWNSSGAFFRAIGVGGNTNSKVLFMISKANVERAAQYLDYKH